MNRFSPSLLHLKGSLYKNHLLPVRVTRKGGIGRGQTGQSPTSTSGTTKICNPNHQRQLSTKPANETVYLEILSRVNVMSYSRLTWTACPTEGQAHFVTSRVLDVCVCVCVFVESAIKRKAGGYFPHQSHSSLREAEMAVVASISLLFPFPVSFFFCCGVGCNESNDPGSQWMGAHTASGDLIRVSQLSRGRSWGTRKTKEKGGWRREQPCQAKSRPPPPPYPASPMLTFVSRSHRQLPCAHCAAETRTGRGFHLGLGHTRNLWIYRSSLALDLELRSVISATQEICGYPTAVEGQEELF
ncbi:hypothetical protein RRG08_065431 [Elysia crispata]|uniref:Uncharacterized protein n=1 Tax=Elysia crispata TaxID=231223 RepID=A0AAE0ZEE7_9GAST|nr:hypothetical protein RRG08_065431 [Elysia crispata]